MKKLLIIAFCISVICGCTKKDPPGLVAHIDYMGSPAVDGLGWVLRFSDQTFEVPSNLADEFKVDELRVRVEFEKTSNRVPCLCLQPRYFVNIISIAKIG